MDLERVLYKKMTKDELIDKLIAYKNIECHDRAIAHEFLCMESRLPCERNLYIEKVKYTKENILNFVNTYCNADFEEVVVLHNLAGYRVFSDCQKKGTSAAYRYGDEFPYDAELTLKRRKKVEEMKKEFCELFHQQRDNTSYWVDDLGQLNVKINTYQTALDAANWTKGRHFIVEV